MRIKTFSLSVDQCANPHRLKDAKLVIDARNFFYRCYEDSKLRLGFGAECDRFADYLRQYLSMFKEANVTCYFIFKGGTKHLENKILKDQLNFDKKIPEKYESHPIFATDIHLQVLEEMKFDYVFSEYEAKSDCIALARKLSCPLLSMDVEFAVSGVSYIPWLTLGFDKKRKIIHCKMFLLENLLKKFNLNKNKLALFILLVDLTYFEENTFTNFFTSRRLPEYPPLKRNTSLLYFLSKTPEETIMQDILRNCAISKDLILENLDKVKNLLVRADTHNVAIDYFFKKEVSEVWFEAGVALNIIAKPYIDLYRTNILLVSGNLVDEKTEHPIQLSLNIIKYAYDLLTDFRNNGFKFISNHRDPNSQPLLVKESIKKPSYQATRCVFENGWDDIRSLGFFEHFMTEEVNFNFDKLEKVPEDAKLLLISLVYFHNKKTGDINKIAYGVILSYIMLGVISRSVDVNGNIVSPSDSKLAAELLEGYFNIRDDEIHTLRVESLLHSLLEFQYCLKEINYLNKLCGSSFSPTIYSKTFNGPFVYKIVHSMHNEDETLFINKILGSAPTVLHVVNHIIELYKNLIV